MKKIILVLMTLAFIQWAPIQKADAIGPGLYWWFYHQQWCLQQGQNMVQKAYECDECDYPDCDACQACMAACENWMTCHNPTDDDAPGIEDCDTICGLHTL